MKSGDMVSWSMIDGRTMAGEVIDLWGEYPLVRRVDGGICTPRRSALRPASWADIESAIGGGDAVKIATR